MFSVLILGFLIGVRHAFEADHIAAVASLATKSFSLGQTIKQGIAWGIGHTVTLFIFGSLVLFSNSLIPENLTQWLEFAVGVMLVLLGVDVWRRLIRDRIHFHAHSHDDGHRHFHAHSHKGQQFAGTHPENHDHEHADKFPIRALFIGLMHGMAGSTALILLTLKTISLPVWGLVYIALFGVGSNCWYGRYQPHHSSSAAQSTLDDLAAQWSAGSGRRGHNRVRDICRFIRKPVLKLLFSADFEENLTFFSCRFVKISISN